MACYLLLCQEGGGLASAQRVSEASCLTSMSPPPPTGLEAIVQKVFVFKRTGADMSAGWVEGRDVWMDELVACQRSVCPPVWMDSEDLLFILFTSGSTGKARERHGAPGLKVHLSIPPSVARMCVDPVGSAARVLRRALCRQAQGRGAHDGGVHPVRGADVPGVV